MTTSIHSQHMRMALEASYGVTPAASSWWQHGRWHELYSDGLSDYQDHQILYFPNTSPETQALNAMSPIILSRRSGGTIKTWADAGTLGVLLTALIGASIDSFTPLSSSLLVNQGITANPQSFGLNTQPPLNVRIEIKGSSNSGNFMLSGSDWGNNEASEIISFDGAGMYYSRNTYKSIAASNFKVTGMSGGSVTLISQCLTRHSMSSTSVPGSLSLQQSGGPDEGGSQFVYPGVMVKSLRIGVDAEAQDGAVTLEGELAGNFSAACTGMEENHGASMQLVWPSWSMSVWRDNASINHVTKATLNIISGNDLGAPAADQQTPQTTLVGPVQVTGDVTFAITNTDLAGNQALGAGGSVLASDGSLIRNRWLGTSNTKLEFDLVTPYRVCGLYTGFITGIFTLNKAFLGDYTLGESNGGYTLSTKFRNVITAASDFTFTLVSNYPGTAFGGNQL